MIIRVAKEDSAFLYALLEAYEGVVNYSTLTSEKGKGYRDILVFSTPSMKGEFDKVMEILAREVLWTVITKEWIEARNHSNAANLSHLDGSL